MTLQARVGQIGEILAAKYLTRQGYQLLEQNFQRLPWGEIDIIAKKSGRLFFFEVKTSSQQHLLYPGENKIDSRKKQALKRTIEIYLSQHSFPLDCWWQADALIITINFPRKTYKLKHIENIFY